MTPCIINQCYWKHGDLNSNYNFIFIWLKLAQRVSEGMSVLYAVYFDRKH